MIYYALEAMQRARIKDVLLTSSPDHCGDFASLLKSGSEFGLHLQYVVQETAGGIAQAISLAEHFAVKEKILVILGDNIFQHNLRHAALEFEKQPKGAKVFAKKMPTESRQYGVVEIDRKGRVISIEEKPEHPKSDLAQTGIYMYDSQVFEFIHKLKPSRRGELEVTDLNNFYLGQGTLTCEVMDGWWVDAGTSFDELLRANMLVAEAMRKK
jgi:glucose-1-phosphate thymidylyltransferase